MAYQSRLELAVDARSGQRELRNFRGELNQTERAGNMTTAAMGKLKGAISLAAAAAGGFSLQRVISETARFDDAMRGLQAVSRATASQMQALEKQARTLGATTAFSAQQAGDAQRFLAQAGLQVNEVLSATPGVLKLATAANMDLAQAADIASNVLGGMGLAVAELDRVMDVMAATAAGSNTSVEQLGQALSFAAPLARAAGISVEEAAAAIGTLSDAGLQASRAGTGLVGVIRQLSNVTPAAASALANYGLSVADVNIETHGLSEVLETLEAANISTADAFAIFGSEAGAAAQILASGAGRVREFTGELGDSEGAASAMADIIGGGLSGSMRSFNSALSESIIRLGRDEGVASGFQAVIDSASGVLSVYNDMLPEFAAANGLTDDQASNLERVAEGLRITATVASTAAGAYATYRGAVMAATIAQTAFNTAVRANPLGLLVTAAGAAVGALYTFRDELGLTQQQTGLTTDELADFRAELDEMDRDDLGASLDTLNTRLEQATLMAATAREELAALRAEENRGSGVLGFGAGQVGAEVRGMQAVAKAEAKLAEIKQRRSEVQRELNERDEEGVERLDDMTVTAERAAGGMRENAEATTAAADAASGYTDELQSLRRRLQPGYAEAERFAQGLNTVNIALAAGRISLGEYAELVQLLQGEMQGADDSIRDLGDTNADTTDEMSREWERFGNSVDDTFADAFAGAFDSFDDFADQLLDGFKRLLAELAYQAALRPIVVGFTQSMGGAMGIPGMGGAGAPSLTGGIGQVSSFFTGNSIGQGISSGANAAYNLVGTGNIYGTSAGSGIYGNVAGISNTGPSWLNNPAKISNISYGLQSIGGGYAGTELGSSLTGRTANSNYGAMAGSIAGSFLPIPGGTFIGSAIGGFLDSVFGSGKKDYHFDFVQGRQPGVFGDRESELGKFGISRFSDYKRGEQQDQLNDLMTSIAEFDNALAAMAIPERVDAMRESIKGFTHSGPDDLFEKRLRAIIDGSGAIAEEALLKVSDAESLGKAFQAALQLESVGQNLSKELMEGAERWIDQAAGTDRFGSALSSMVEAAKAASILTEASEQLGIQFDSTSAGAIHVASKLQATAGGVQNLSNLHEAYYQAVYTEEERLSRQVSAFSTTLSSVTDSTVSTTDQLRALVEAQDLNTEAGRDTYLQLLQLSPALAQTSQAVKQAITEAYQTSLDRAPDAAGLTYWMDEVMSGSITLESALDKIAHSAEATADASEDAAEALEDYADALSKKEDLERQLLRLQGDEEALRERELGDLRKLAGAEEVGLIALQKRIWALEDEKDALDELSAVATAAVEPLTQAAADYQAAMDKIAAATEKSLSALNSVQGGYGDLRGQIDEALGISGPYMTYDGADERVREAVDNLNALAKNTADTLAKREEEMQQRQDKIDQLSNVESEEAQALRDSMADVRAQAEEAWRAQESLFEEQIAAAEAQQQAAEQLRQLYDSLQLASSSILDPLERLTEARSQYQEVLAAAQGGDTDAIGELRDVSNQYLEEAAGYYGQASGQYSDIWRSVTGSIDEMADEMAAESRSVESLLAEMAEAEARHTDRLESQLAAIEWQAQEAQRQAQEQANAAIETLEGMSYSTTGSLEALKEKIIEEEEKVRELMAEIEAEKAEHERDARQAVIDALTVQVDTLDGINTIGSLMGQLPQNLARELGSIIGTDTPSGAVDPQGVYLDTGGFTEAQSAINSIYQSELGRNADQAGLAYWLDQLQGGQSLAEIQAAIAYDAAHGAHAKGLGNVPFDGYRAVLHQGEMVLPAPLANTIRSAVDGGKQDALIAEVRALREEVSRLRSERNQDASRASTQRERQTRELERNRRAKAHREVV